MWNPRAERDERAIAVEHRAGYVAYQVVGYLLILDMVLRTWRPGLVEWDLGGLMDRPMPIDVWVIGLVGGLVQWGVMLRERTIGPVTARWTTYLVAGSMLLAALIAMILSR